MLIPPQANATRRLLATAKRGATADPYAQRTTPEPEKPGANGEKSRVDLIRSGGCAKNEFFGELERSKLHLRLEQLGRERSAGGKT